MNNEQDTIDAVYLTKDYLDYQKKYLHTMRESDKVLLRHVNDAVQALHKPLHEVHILDIGCNTGNFLHAMAAAFPGVHYTGVEPFEEIIHACRQDTRLQDMHFDIGDVRELKYLEQFDIIIVNAVLFHFSPEVYSHCLEKIYLALKTGGFFLGFDLFTPFPQLLKIQEYTPLHPQGMTLYFRPMENTRERFIQAGFATPDFYPFEIPIDLVPQEDNNPAISYTELSPSGVRRIYRGDLYQPWCHFVARKP